MAINIPQPQEPQQLPSKIKVKINFQKSQDMIAKLRSKANYITYSPDNLSVVAEITDGLNLKVVSEDQGEIDMRDDLIGQTINVRLTQEQFDVLNHEIDLIEGVGASVIYNVSDHVRMDWLDTKKDGLVLALAVYPDDIESIEPVKVNKVGSILKMEDIRRGLQEAKERSQQKREEARNTNRMMRQSANEANADRTVTADMY